MTDPAPDLSPAMLAVDLDSARWPDWVVTELAPRFADAHLFVVGAKRRSGWQVYAQAVADVSGLPIVPRNVWRVLINRGVRDDGVTVGDITARRIAERVPCHMDHALRALLELERDGWLHVTRKVGCAHRLTLMVPVDDPRTPVEPPRHARGSPPRHARETPAPRAGGPPRHARDTGSEDPGITSGSEDQGCQNENAVPRGAADPWDDFYAPTRWEDVTDDE